MLKLQTASLREFQKRANQIPANTLLPILSNLKIDVTETCVITKNSINSICMGLVEFEGERQQLLVPERILFAVLSVTQDEWITIDKGVIKSGSDTVGFTEENIKDFPNPPAIPDQPSFLLTKENIKSISVASGFVNDHLDAGTFGLVHLSGDSIFAFHPNYFYINESFKDLPTVGFNPDEIAVISAQESIEFLDLPNHHIFFTAHYTYIFIKSEAQTPKLQQVMERLRLPGKPFTCNKYELVNFISLANNVSESEIATCSITQDGLFAKLLMNDASYGRNNERIVTISGELDEFTFNSRVIANAIKSIPYEVLNAKTNQNCLIIQSENEWFCFIGMSKS